MILRSKYFTEAEVFESSATARRLHIINTTSDPKILAAVQYTAAKMDRVREFLDSPILVKSWYRCPRLNDLVGGAANSQHMAGEAVDFVAPAAGTPKEICQKLSHGLKDLGIDQLILEPTWVHISFVSDTNRVPRGQILTWVASGKYIKGLGD